jgi:putative oxidoreductase
MKLSTRNLAWRILEIAIAALFIYAGVLKVLDPIGFAGDIENYHIVPWVIGAPLAIYLPWLEIVCGAALALRRGTRGALAILTALTIVFIGASIIAKARGIDVSCGCFGHAARSLSFASHLAIDFAILAVLALLVRRAIRETTGSAPQ